MKKNLHPIAYERKKRFLNTKELSDEIGLESDSTLRAIESGWIKTTDEKMDLLSSYFNINRDRFKNRIIKWEREFKK